MAVQSLTFPAAPESLATIGAAVLVAARAAGLDLRAAYRLRQAVDELATNAIAHGSAGAEPGWIDLHTEADETTLRVVLEDTGVPFDPRTVPPPRDLGLPAEERQMGGLGIYLALGGVDSFRYEREGGRNRNILVMDRPAPGGFPRPEVTAMAATKGKVGVLVEAHFDETEYRRFGDFFPAHGYAVEYVSHLWGQRHLTFKGNDNQEEVTVGVEVNDAAPEDYAGLILIGGYAMDRLRYEESPQEGRPNQAPAVVFLRKAVARMDQGRLRIGAICHGLWLFCAAPELLKGRKVTCAHNIMGDVANAGGAPVFDGHRLADTHVDGGLVTGRHPGVVEEFMSVFLKEIEKH
jgi:putative intracellular protease/amidase/anti-sigma regulatory factor (Ser/Thr protein kinase)